MSFSKIQNLIISVLWVYGDLDRERICSKTKLARTTVYDNLAKLERKDIVKKYKQNGGYIHRGRPRIYWKLNKERLIIT